MTRTVRKASAPEPVDQSPWYAAFPWQAAALCLLVLIAYWNSLEGSFHFDDWSLLSDPDVAGPGVGWRLFRLGLTRPLTYWSFHLNFLAGGGQTNTIGFHLVSIALHAANSVLLLWIARRHVAAPAALLAAGLFAVHPLETEAVSYIFARSSLLATFFALLAFALFLRGRRGWSAAAFGFSLLAKEEGAALPAFLLLYDFLFVSGRHGRQLAPRKWYYAGLLGLAALAAARLFYVLKTAWEPGIGFEVRGVSALVYALTQPRVIWRYLRLIVLPLGQNLDYDMPLSRSLWTPATTLPALLGLAALLGWLAWKVIAGPGLGPRRAMRPGLKPGPAGTDQAAGRGGAADTSARWPFWMLAYFILLAPSSSIVAQSDVIYEHRTYLPMTGMAVALGSLLWRALERLGARSARVAAAVALLAALSAFTVARNRVWADELSLWRDVVAKSPVKGRPYIGLSRGLAQDNRPVEARRALERGLQAEPDNRDLRMNLGVMLLEEGNAREALPHFKRAIELGRETPEAWNNAGAAYSMLGQQDKAIEAYRRALSLSPCFYNSRRNLMAALADGGRFKEAIATGAVPAGCRLLPEQEQELERIRSAIAGRVAGGQ